MRQRDVELRELREVAEAAADLQSTDQQAAKVIDLSKKVGGQGLKGRQLTFRARTSRPLRSFTCPRRCVAAAGWGRAGMLAGLSTCPTCVNKGGRKPWGG